MEIVTSNDTTVWQTNFLGTTSPEERLHLMLTAKVSDPAAGGICTGALVTPANNNDAIWYACFDM